LKYSGKKPQPRYAAMPNRKPRRTELTRPR
jgi:hypothetical protein